MFSLPSSLRAVLAGAIICLSLAMPAVAQSTKPTFATPGPCIEGTLPGGARSLICVPRERWNGNLVVFAHGYVAPTAPLAFADLTLPDGTRLPDLIQQLGFAFATTTYRQNGVAILEGVDDLLELVKAFPVVQHGPPARTFVTGISEGGLVALLAAEQRPDAFDAALSTCGAVGGLSFQINYVGDVRVLFDAYFPGVLPGSAFDIPASLQTNWDRVFAPAVATAIRNAPSRARELLTVARVPHDARDVAAITSTVVELLWRNVSGANDWRQKLGGNAYDNRLRWYAGSSNDASLNLRVKRVDADLAALIKLQQYTPRGDIRVPVVTLHTTGDPIVPYAHQLLLTARARPSGRGRLVPVPSPRFGHCAFQTSEYLAGFALMLGAGQSTLSPVAPVANEEFEDGVERRF